MGEIQIILVDNPEGRVLLDNLGIDGKITF
jgi:hypothetical protein